MEDCSVTGALNLEDEGRLVTEDIEGIKENIPTGDILKKVMEHMNIPADPKVCRSKLVFLIKHDYIFEELLPIDPQTRLTLKAL